MGVYILRAVDDLQIARATCCDPPADAARLIQHDWSQPRIRRSPRAGYPAMPEPMMTMAFTAAPLAISAGCSA